MSEGQGEYFSGKSVPKKGRRGNHHNILVADDDGLVRGLIHTILTRQGYRVTLCSNGNEVLRIAGKEDWSLLIVDLHMPSLSGLEVVQQIRAGGFEHPAILMSGMMTDEVVEECGRLGGVECLSKPFEVAGLLGLVSQLIS